MNPPVDVGEMRTLIAYEEYVETRDKARAPIKSWVALWTGRAAVRPLSAKEQFFAGGQQSQVTHRVAIRYRPGVKQKARFRVVGTGRVLNITGVLNVEDRNAWLVCQAVEKAE